MLAALLILSILALHLYVVLSLLSMLVHSKSAIPLFTAIALIVQVSVRDIAEVY